MLRSGCATAQSMSAERALQCCRSVFPTTQPAAVSPNTLNTQWFYLSDDSDDDDAVTVPSYVSSVSDDFEWTSRSLSLQRSCASLKSAAPLSSALIHPNLPTCNSVSINGKHEDRVLLSSTKNQTAVANPEKILKR